jgi:hypothetical protein
LWIDDHAFHCRSGVASRRNGRQAIVAIWNNDTPAIWVQLQFGGIESQPNGRIGNSLNSISIDLSRAHAWCPHVPIVIRSILDRIEPNSAGRGAVIIAIEEQQFHAGGSARVECEIDDAAKNRRPEWKGPSSFLVRLHRRGPYSAIGDGPVELGFFVILLENIAL